MMMPIATTAPRLFMLAMTPHLRDKPKAALSVIVDRRQRKLLAEIFNHMPGITGRADPLRDPVPKVLLHHQLLIRKIRVQPTRDIGRCLPRFAKFFMHGTSPACVSPNPIIQALLPLSSPLWHECSPHGGKKSGERGLCGNMEHPPNFRAGLLFTKPGQRAKIATKTLHHEYLLSYSLTTFCEDVWV